MPRVFIPPMARDMTEGREEVEISGSTVREVIESLEERFPGVKQRLCQNDQLRPGLSVAVNTKVTSLGMLQAVAEDAEVHFLPAIGGG